MRAFIVLLFLVGCATSKETYTPDGSLGYSVDCSGTKSWSPCYEKAGELCGSRGYLVVAGGSEQGFVATQVFAGSTISRSMVIRCK